MAMIGIAELQCTLRHAVETQKQDLRLERESANLGSQVGFQSVNVGAVVVIRRQGPKCRLPTHFPQLVRSLVHNRGRRSGRILRIHWRKQYPVAAVILERLHAVGDRGCTVAHRPIDANLCPKGALHRLGLVARDHG